MTFGSSDVPEIHRQDAERLRVFLCLYRRHFDIINGRASQPPEDQVLKITGLRSRYKYSRI